MTHVDQTRRVATEKRKGEKKGGGGEAERRGVTASPAG